MLREKTDTPVMMVSSRSTVKEPRMPSAPIASGRQAAVRLPNITSSRISTIGNDRPSARVILAVVCLSISASVGTTPPTWLCRPGALRSVWIAS
jgi:hypothetical protein